MVTTDIAQLSRECNAWRETLRSYRDEFGQLKSRLQDLAGHQTNRDVLLEIDHLDNQFYIQLINIHDLKQSIKTHERKIHVNQENVSDDVFAEHESLLSEFLGLESTLQELRNDFKNFINKTSC